VNESLASNAKEDGAFPRVSAVFLPFRLAVVFAWRALGDDFRTLAFLATPELILDLRAQ